MTQRNSGVFIFSPAVRALAAAMLLTGVTSAADAAPASPTGSLNWVATRTHAASTVDAAFEGNATDQEPVSIAVALKLRNEGKLNNYIHDLFRRGSSNYHRFLTTEQSREQYAPTPQQAQAVADYLTKQGFTNVQIASNNLVVTASGTVGAARHAFRTDVAHFKRHGHQGIVNTADVQIPAALSGDVDQVLGLQTLNRARTFSRQPSYNLTTQSGKPAYRPQEFSTIYHAGNTPTGTGTTAAIIGWGSMTNAAADVAGLTQTQNLPAVPTSIVSSTASSNDDTGQGEWGMDAQAIVGISGGVKRLIFYTSGGNASYDSVQRKYKPSGNDDRSLLTIINRAVSDNSAKVINMSWGIAECYGSVGFADSAFKLGVSQGQTFVASSGDNGSYPCLQADNTQPENGTYSTNKSLSVNYPASSPYVVAVGGTTLNTSTSDAYISETTWPYSGGGISASEATPPWQPSSYPYREVPDLAFDADWDNSPIAMYLTASTTSGIKNTAFGYVNGGTSLSAPLFVGAWARLESANGNKLGFAAPAIYAYSGTLPFHDVTTGDNGYYAAGVGYDTVTGWGSFDIQAVKDFIVQNPGFISATQQGQ